jgi:hypothetical protein
MVCSLAPLVLQDAGLGANELQVALRSQHLKHLMDVCFVRKAHDLYLHSKASLCCNILKDGTLSRCMAAEVKHQCVHRYQDLRTL